MSDIIEHELSEDCICGPTPHLVETESGDVWQYTHHSLDGRENNE